jgi:hypothetical protein
MLREREREVAGAWYQNLRGVGDGTSRGAVDLKGLEVLLQQRDIFQISQFLCLLSEKRSGVPSKR